MSCTKLTDINIYIGGTKSNSILSQLINVYQQFEYTRDNISQNIDLSIIKKIISEVEGSNLKKIRLLGGNIFGNEDLFHLSRHLNKLTTAKIYVSHYLDLPDEEDKYQMLCDERNELQVLVDFPLNHEKILSIVDFLKNINLRTSWLFAITSEDEYFTVESLVGNFQLRNAEIKPVYNGHNNLFFEENVYISEDDVNEILLSRQEIYLRQKINIFDFGKLTIFEDGSVYANVNQRKLGNIADNQLIDLLIEELRLGYSWRRIRNTKPCCGCVYQWLCPSPTNYELVLGNSNLCNLKYEEK